MIVKPKNNWIQVDLPLGKERESPYEVLLPADYKPAEKPYKEITVCSDPKEEYKHGDIVVVPTHIIREVDLEEGRFYLIERSHVMALVEE
tara:strand:+ start:1164 stop:1433 length:270 start_codon:yes stop_codon:yes gene_type:complete